MPSVPIVCNPQDFVQSVLKTHTRHRYYTRASVFGRVVGGGLYAVGHDMVSCKQNPINSNF